MSSFLDCENHNSSSFLFKIKFIFNGERHDTTGKILNTKGFLRIIAKICLLLKVKNSGLPIGTSRATRLMHQNTGNSPCIANFRVSNKFGACSGRAGVESEDLSKKTHST